MTSRKVLTALAALALMAGVATANIVSPDDSWATMANSPATLTIAPGGYDGLVLPVDHTIDVYVNDATPAPVEILYTDIWLEHPDVTWCEGGVVADSSTYAPDPGHTTFTAVPRGSTYIGNAGAGWTDCQSIAINVVALGFVIDTVDLNINSMDLTADGHVDIADLGGFASVKDIPAQYPIPGFCADYDEDGDCDIADLGQFASVYNLSDCPEAP